MSSTAIVRRASYRITDPLSGKDVLVFESEDNDDLVKPESKCYTRMMFYISPVCHFCVTNADITSPPIIDGKWRYSIRMRQYDDSLRDIAARAISRQMSAATSSHEFDRTNVSKLAVDRITFNSPYPWIEFDPLGGENGAIPVDNDTFVAVSVVDGRRGDFEALVQSTAGVPVTVKIHHVGLVMKSASVTLSDSYLRNTQTYRDLDSGGGQYVSAKQIQTIVMEAAYVSNATLRSEAGMEAKLEAALSGVFAGLLSRFKQTEVVITSEEQAQQIDTELRRGTGLGAQDFRPLVLMWHMIDEVKLETQSAQANQRLRTYYDENKNSFDCSFGGADSGLSGALGFGTDEKSIQQGVFKEDTELRDFKSRHVQGEGPAAHVVAMGVKLLERGNLSDNIALNQSAVVVDVDSADVVTPISARIATVLPSPLGSRSNCPVGCVVAYAAEKAPEGWLMCDGMKYDVRDNPKLSDLCSLIRHLYTEPTVEPECFRVPDYRGVFLRGMDNPLGNRAAKIDPDWDRRKIGSVQPQGTAAPKNENAFVAANNGSHSHAFCTSKFETGGGLQGVFTYSWGNQGWHGPEDYRQDGRRNGGIDNAGIHHHDISGGDPETRPINVAVNWIIKY